MPDVGILIIDGNALCYASAAHEVLRAGDMETQAIWGFLGHARSVASRFPMLSPVIAWDGKSWRHDYFPDYKGSRDKVSEVPKPHELEKLRVRKAAKDQKRHVVRLMRTLGVPQITATNLEADDLAGILTRRHVAKGRRVVLVTGDRDWCQLIRPGVAWHCPIATAKVPTITHQSLPRHLGVADGRQWLELKALMGDPSDEIPGVGGIGEVTGKALLAEHGSVNAFWMKVSTREIDIAKLPKKLRNFCESERGHDAFLRNMALMDLESGAIPKPKDLDVDHGAHDLDAFSSCCADYAFHSILRGDLPGYAAPFKRTA